MGLYYFSGCQSKFTFILLLLSFALFRGDIARERGSKQKLFKELNNEITGLAFKVSANRSFLFVSTYKDVVVYNISQKDKEQKVGCRNYKTVH